jgi:lambda family phage tail tape measure protein
MPISAADVKIILSAQDQASGVVKQFGSNAEKAMRDAEASTTKLNQRMNELRNAVTMAIQGFLAYRGMTFLKSSIDEAERMQNTLRGLAAVARYAGQNLGEALQAASKLAEDGLVDVTSASRALQNLLTRGYNLQESIDILTRLKDAAAFNRQGQLSMAEAVISATEGLKNENSILVDNAGVTKNVSVMWKEYASEIGKSAASLSQAEKRQAEYNGIMKETEAHIGNAKRATEGITGAKAKLSVEVIKLKNGLGNDLAPAFLSVAKAANWTLQNAIIPFIGGIEIMAAKTAGFFDKTNLRVKIWSLESSQWAVKDPKKKAENERLIASMKGELNRVDSVVSELIDEIMRKWSGALKIPDIGADSGKRRTDTVVNGADVESIKRLREQWEETSLALSAKIEGGGLDDLRKALIQNELEADKLKKKFKDLPSELKVEAYAKIDRARLTADDEAVAKATEKARKEAVDGVKKETEEKLKAIAEQKKAFLTLKALREGEINARLSELDLTEKEGALHRDTLSERLRLMQELIVIQDEYLLTLDKQADPSSWYAQLDAINRTKGAIIDLNDEFQKTTFLGSIGNAWREIEEDASHTSEQIGERFKTAFGEMTDAIAEFARTGKFEFSSLAQSIINDLIRIQLKELEVQAFNWIKLGIGIVAKAIGGTTDFGAGSEAGYAISDQGGGYGGIAGGYHSGGMGSEPSFIRIGLNPHIFDTAPRYHSGIGPGETAAIIRKDEGVFTPGQMKAMGEKASSPNIRIINVLDPGIVENWASSPSGEKVIMNIIRRNS